MRLFTVILFFAGLGTITLIAIGVTVYRIVTGWLLTCMEEAE